MTVTGAPAHIAYLFDVDDEIAWPGGMGTVAKIRRISDDAFVLRVDVGTIDLVSVNPRDAVLVASTGPQAR